MNDELGPQCTSCGARNAAGQRFCTSCGTPLPEPGRPLFADEVAPEETAPTVVLGSCRSCGAHLAPGLKFCTECGTAVAAEAAPAPAAPVPPPPPRPGCPRCGAETTPGLRFCTSCGTPLAGGGPAAPVPSPVPAYLPDRRRRGRWVAAVLVAVLLVAGGGLGAWFLTRDDDTSRASDSGASDERSSASDESPGDDASETADGEQEEPSESASSEPSPSATASSEPPAPVTCWDGAPAQQVSDCSSPDGRAGLEYVFPSMATQSCSGLGASPAIGRTLLVQCLAYLDDGTEIKINYSKWESVTAAQEHYDEKLTRTSAAGGAYFTWTGRAGRQYNAAGLFVTEPFSTSVYAPTEEDLTLALGLLQGRPPDQVRGGPTT